MAGTAAAIHHRPAPATTEGWKRYINDQIDKRERATLRAVAEVVVAEERQREAMPARLPRCARR